MITGEVCLCRGREFMGHNLSFSQFLCDHKTALKIKSTKRKQNKKLGDILVE